MKTYANTLLTKYVSLQQQIDNVMIADESKIQFLKINIDNGTSIDYAYEYDNIRLFATSAIGISGQPYNYLFRKLLSTFDFIIKNALN